MNARRKAAGRQRRHQAAPGLTAGPVLRAARHSAHVSMKVLAAAARIDQDCLRYWEYGSSSLADVPAPELQRLKIALTDHGADQSLVTDLDAAAWCDLVIAAVAAGEPVNCLLADPITGETAFRELLCWSMTEQVPARYRRYATPSPLMANRVLADRVRQVIESVHPALAAECFARRQVSVPGSQRPPESRLRHGDFHDAGRKLHDRPHQRAASTRCPRRRL